MKRLMLAAALVASGASASPALAADEVIRGTDELVWDKPNVSILPVEKITWIFPGTVQVHHASSDGADFADPVWTSFNSPLAVLAPDASFVFKTPGTYKFVCTVHRTTMFGTVYVGTTPAPPPPPVPLSQQPLANDVTAPPATLEQIDEDKAKPKLSSVSARRSGSRAVRVRFRVSEESTVQVRLKRAGKTIKTALAYGKGTGSVTLRGAKAGRYSVQVRATDVAGNRSALKQTSVTFR